MKVLTAILLLLLVQGLPAQSQAIVEGVVVDDDSGQPLSGVVVRLSSAQSTTDDRGRFSLTVAQRGRFRVVPTRNGYVSVRKNHAIGEAGTLVDVAPETQIRDLELRMAKSAVIRGRVLNGDGSPAFPGNLGTAGVRRFSFGTDGKRTLLAIPGASPNGPFSQRMNDQGEFRFYDLAPGDYYIGIGGGFGPFGSPSQMFYPGTMDQAKAVPITVKSGDDINIGVITVPPRTKGTEVWLDLDTSGFTRLGGGLEMFIDSGLVFMSGSGPQGETRLPDMAPGKHTVVLTNGVSLGGEKASYVLAEFEVGNESTHVKAQVKEGTKLSTKTFLENQSGERVVTTQAVGCQLRRSSGSGAASCTSTSIVPTSYQIEFRTLPADMYVVSARSGDHDVIKEGLHVTGDAELEIVISNDGAIARGIVRDANGAPVSDATVAVVPSEDKRGTGFFYRSGVTDYLGQYEMHGIAPGEYKLFAWPDLEGAAYLNAEFMKIYEDRGKPVKFEKGGTSSADLPVLQ